MSGVCVEKLPHSCGTQTGLQVFANPETGKVDGYCYSCKTFVPDPYGKEVSVDEIELPEPKSEEEIQQQISDINHYPVVDVPSRKLRKNTLETFNAKVGISEEDGKTPTEVYFPTTKENKHCGYLVKTLSKPSHVWFVGDTRGIDPINWDQAKSSGAYRLIITEGPFDMVSVARLYEQFGKPEYQPAVISLPYGASSVKKSLQPIAETIRRNFREIVLCFDDDKPGHKAVEEAMMIFPTAQSVILPEKDANDCVMKGKQKAAFKSLAFDAHTPKNSRLVTAEDLHTVARHPTERGELTWPFQTLDNKLRGIRYGETIYIGAGVKMGKSELLNDLAAHFILNHDAPVFLVKPEEELKKSYRMMCNKIAGKVFTDPDREFDYEAYDYAGEILKGKLTMLDLYQHVGWETLKYDIISAASSGVKAVFIDPITNLTNGLSAAEANTKLQEISQDLSSMAKDLNIVIFLFCHCKAPDGVLGKDARQKRYTKDEYVGLGNHPHEYGGDVLSSQFSGSRAMMRSCNLMLGLEGNKDPEIPEHIQRQRWISILEDREFGNTGRVRITWDPKTTRYSEV